jgi:type IV secretory pathway TrbL component
MIFKYESWTYKITLLIMALISWMFMRNASKKYEERVIFVCLIGLAVYCGVVLLLL